MALNAYMTMTSRRLGPIMGSVTIRGREGSIEVHAYSQRGAQPIDARTGLATMSRQHTPITITKPLDRATPLIGDVLWSRDTLTSVQIGFPQPGFAGLEEIVFTVDLTDARVTQVRHELLNTEYAENNIHFVREHVTMTYERIAWSWVSTGATASDTWSGPTP
jgi:type VI secretion system secreted protein Hcp